jgi:hypothetical protein
MFDCRVALTYPLFAIARLESRAFSLVAWERQVPLYWLINNGAE